MLPAPHESNRMSLTMGFLEWGVVLVSIGLACFMGTYAGVCVGAIAVERRKEEAEEWAVNKGGVNATFARDLVFNEGENEVDAAPGCKKGQQEKNNKDIASGIGGSAQRSVIIDVGGMVFTTTLATIMAVPNYFSANLRFRGLQGGDSDGDSGLGSDSDHDPVAFFVDRDPTHFRHVLNHLRSGSASPCHLSRVEDISELLLEARFYALPSLASELESMLSDLRKADGDLSTSEKEFKLVHVRGVPGVEHTFKSYVSKGYEFVQVMEVGGGAGMGLTPPASPARRGTPQAGDAMADDGFRAVMVFSKR